MALVIGQTDMLAVNERWEKYQNDIEIKIAGIDCDDYQIALERARRLIAREDVGQSLAKITVSTADRKEHDIQCELLGRFIVRDWKGAIEDKDGKKISYSPEMAATLLKGNIDLFVWVISKATKISADERTEAAETVEKQ